MSITTVFPEQLAHNGRVTSKRSGKGENHQRGLAPSLFFVSVFVSGFLEESVEVVLGNDRLLAAVLEQKARQSGGDDAVLIPVRMAVDEFPHAFVEHLRHLGFKTDTRLVADAPGALWIHGHAGASRLGRPKYATGKAQRQKRLQGPNHHGGSMRLLAPAGLWPGCPATRQRPMAAGGVCQGCSEQPFSFPSPRVPGQPEGPHLWKKPHESGENGIPVGESPEPSETVI